MPGTENNPEYINKHPKAIHLDTYRGVACDLMVLNDPIADRIMEVSDMRGDIIIIQKPQDRVRDYEDVGFVKVAKFLRMPRLDVFQNGKGFVQTKREDNNWYLAINDQDLANQVARTEGDDRKFDDRFVEAFKREVQSGIATVLRREKLLNGGKYSFGFFASYHGLLSYNLLLGPTIITQALLYTEPELAIKGLAIVALSNAIYNGLNLFGAGMTVIEQQMFTNSSAESNRPEYNDPFVRHSLTDFVMPPVPLDRLARGMYYLNTHTQDLIGTVKNN